LGITQETLLQYFVHMTAVVTCSYCWASNC